MNKEFKFDNFDSLQNSYCELERKFTQKCQHNAELEKQRAELTEQCDKLTSEQQQIIADNEMLKKQIEEIKNNGGINAQNASPQLSVEQLYEQHPIAVNFKDKLDEVIANPEQGEVSMDAWKQRYVQCLEESFRTPEQILQDKQFLQQYVVNNADVRDLVLQNLLQENLQGSYPVTISGNGGNMSMAQPNRPKTLQEASVLAKNYFK